VLSCPLFLFATTRAERIAPAGVRWNCASRLLLAFFARLESHRQIGEALLLDLLIDMFYFILVCLYPHVHLRKGMLLQYACAFM
jgi:hypothetical protein